MGLARPSEARDRQLLRHDWYRVPVEEQAADPDKYPGRPMDGDSVTFWASCRGCGGTIVAVNDKSPDRWHEDWVMEEDCNMQVVRDVMGS